MKKTSILIVLLLCLPLSIGGVPLQSGYDLFQKALMLERGDGNLAEAILIYQRIVKETQDESLAAKAQLQIGICFEKLGQSEARAAYQKVVDLYPGQSQEVAAARERIAALDLTGATIAGKPRFRQIRVPVAIAQGAQLSPDGSLFTFSSTRYEGSIWGAAIPGRVSEDIAGEPIKLTGDINAWAWGQSWSADGKWIAFNQLNNQKDIFVDSACVIPATGGTAKCIRLPTNRGGNYHLFQYCLSLSPDGSVLAFASREDGKSFLYTIPVNGGEATRLTEANTWLPAFSPDGAKIAYVKEREAGSDVWVIPSSGGSPLQISNLGGRATGPIWSPDSRYIAFNRHPDPENLNGTEIWIVPVSETGEPANPATEIQLPLKSLSFSSVNMARPLGWTYDNRIGLLLETPRHVAIYSVPLTGGKATQIAPDNAVVPDWKANGNRIFYCFDGRIYSMAADGGPATAIPVGGAALIPGSEQWSVSPDGQQIVFPSVEKTERGDRWHLFSAPVGGGEPKQITVSPGTDTYPKWSPEGRSVMFIRQFKVGDSARSLLCVVDLPEGPVRELSLQSTRASTWSPDGQSLTYASGNQIKMTSLDGAKTSILAELGEAQSGVNRMAWSPDGGKLAYSTNNGIFILDPASGKIEKISTGMEAVSAGPLTWSPDGEKIAFAAGKGGDLELWLMEDFLPLVKR